ncbi:MAG: ATP-binding protein [Defluviitaleaceae bacterium]|nr:ATP-binding protein [Defluviitaleaceae bacterium]
MGYYVNPGSRKFKMGLNSEIYVDKSHLLAETNALFDTERRFVCLSRPRRFGKTMAANMMAAYYGSGEDAGKLFENLNISTHESYEQHLNQYTVIMINMQVFLSEEKAKASRADKALSVSDMLMRLEQVVTEELLEICPEDKFKDTENFVRVMYDAYQATKKPFVILIDEWDCLFREYKDDKASQTTYLDFLRLWLKDQAYIGLAYMTGILPIKKYGSHSALNMFDEYSMTRPRRFLDYFGFTAQEVATLCNAYDASISEIETWYNGYFVDLDKPIYNPTSVVQSLLANQIDNYWNKTETYEALKDYIALDFDGLKNKLLQMISGYAVAVNANKFTNDMTTFNSADDVLTLLVHLGYLSYNFEKKEVRIPNEEVKTEFINSIEDMKDWASVVTVIHQSRDLLQAIWHKEAEIVAKGIEAIHEQNTSILQYHDENSLACVISLALYGANTYYTIIRELPTGKGYADLVFIPRKKHLDKPAIVVELKWNKDAKGALAQIKERNYASALTDYEGNLLLVGINYDKDKKTHTCEIEQMSL